MKSTVPWVIIIIVTFYWEYFDWVAGMHRDLVFLFFWHHHQLAIVQHINCYQVELNFLFNTKFLTNTSYVKNGSINSNMDTIKYDNYTKMSTMVMPTATYDQIQSTNTSTGTFALYSFPNELSLLDSFTSISSSSSSSLLGLERFAFNPCQKQHYKG